MQVLKYLLDVHISMPAYSPSYVSQQPSREALNFVLDYLMDYLINYLIFDVIITSLPDFHVATGENLPLCFAIQLACFSLTTIKCAYAHKGSYACTCMHVASDLEPPILGLLQCNSTKQVK